MMKLISVNVAMPEAVSMHGTLVSTGIYKLPQSGRVWLGFNNLIGDGQADLTVHGGEYQAAYSYPIEHYQYWQQFLGMDNLPYGTFGENFTISGLLEEDAYIGDILSIGEAVIQVTMPRNPCFKFGHKIGKPGVVREFLVSGRSGFYHKVLTKGEVGAGDEIKLLERDPQSISIRAALGMQKLEEGNAETLRHALTIKSLPPVLRENFADRLEQITST